jgi:hypothetical protein
MPRYFLVAGCDFGTSFSKVVLREQNTRRCAVVAFPQHADGLLPNLVGCDGVWLFPPAGLSAHPRVPYLKMLAADVAAGVPLAQAQVCLPDAAARFAHGNGQRFVRELLAFYFAHLIATVGEFIRAGSP